MFKLIKEYLPLSCLINLTKTLILLLGEFKSQILTFYNSSFLFSAIKIKMPNLNPLKSRTKSPKFTKTLKKPLNILSDS